MNLAPLRRGSFIRDVGPIEPIRHALLKIPHALVRKNAKLKTKSPRLGSGGGGIKTLGSSSADRLATSREFPQHSENFFWPRAQGISKRTNRFRTRQDARPRFAMRRGRTSAFFITDS